MPPRDFVVLFQEKEGTCALMRTLDRFARVDVLRVEADEAWEPFQKGKCGDIRIKDYRRCLDLIFDPSRTDAEELGSIYCKTARLGPLVPFDKSKSVGFKMRFFQWPSVRLDIGPAIRLRRMRAATVSAMKDHDVVVFIVVRQDVLRWALSKYHGDGTGSHGHLQFRLARGEIREQDIPSIEVDCDALEDVVRECDVAISRKRDLLVSLRRRGLDVHPLFYEEFCSDKLSYFTRLLALLGIGAGSAEIRTAVEEEGYFKKVHSDDISEFVTNHHEVTARFGGRFRAFGDES